MPGRQTEADHTSKIRGGTLSHIPPDPRYSAKTTSGSAPATMLEVDIDPSSLDQQLAALMDPSTYRDLAGDS